jgi:hypothetical protein
MERTDKGRNLAMDYIELKGCPRRINKRMEMEEGGFSRFRVKVNE